MKAKFFLVAFFLFLLIFSMNHASAQTAGTDFYAKSLKTNHYGMLFLGSWAAGNLISGAYGWSRLSGERKYFNQMNFFWNTVNISIATFATLSGMSENIYELSTTQMLDKHLKTENLYLINAGLDVAYMLGGAYLLHLSAKKTAKKDILAGYGRSVVLQGAFLFAFDTGMYFLQRHNRLQFLAETGPTGDLSLGFYYLF